MSESAERTHKLTDDRRQTSRRARKEEDPPRARVRACTARGLSPVL